LRIPIPLHGFSHEFQCRSLISGLRDIGFKHRAFMIDSTPQIVGLSTDFYEYLVQVPLPLRALAYTF
jgi:hypothetical protein